MVDTSNRLLANAARFRWEQGLARWLAPEQRGFLPHRSMLANIVDIETEAMKANMTSSSAAIVLYDFAAAFPSISQQFLFCCLEKLGFPPGAVRFVRSLYCQHRGIPTLDGARGGDILLTAGIRQGCPLSPLLFVVAVDGLLRMVPQISPNTVTRMFADDTAMVLQDYASELSRLDGIFKELAAATHLQLNVAKCVLIPLCEIEHTEMRRNITTVAPSLDGMAIKDHGKYLGYFVGPGKTNKTWMSALAKAELQVRAWSWAPLGLFFAATVWNTFILPILGFAAQLEAPPAQIQQHILRMLRRAAHGPGQWFRTEDVLHLKRGFNFTTEFKDIRDTAKAAMFRVTNLEDRWNGGLQACARSSELREKYRTTRLFEQTRSFADWHSQAFVHQLADLVQDFRHNLGIRCSRVEHELSGGEARPWSHATTVKVRKNFQKHVTELLRSQTKFDAEARVRQNLERFGLRDRRQAALSLRRLRALGQAVPPRVWASVFGCIWNRWPTARRMQQIGSHCLLGCGLGEDSLEHYSDCPVVVSFARQKLDIHMKFSRRMHYWTLAATEDSETCQAGWWSRLALLEYAVCRTTNAARHTSRSTATQAAQALWQAALEGARGSNILKHFRPEDPEREASVANTINVNVTTLPATNAPPIATTTASTGAASSSRSR